MNGSLAYLLDSNILVYAFDASDIEKRAKATTIVEHFVESQTGAISTQVMGEVFVNLTRRSRIAMPEDEAAESVITMAQSFHVIQISFHAVEEAMRITRRYQLVYWDALIWAAAKLANINTILSEDMQDGQIIEGVSIRNPFRDDFELASLT